MTRTPILIALVSLLSGCTASGPADPVPTPQERPSTGDADLLRCSTVAFEGEDWWPVALRISFDLQGENAYFVDMTLGDSHPNQEGVLAEPTAAWSEQAYLTMQGDDLVLDGADLWVDVTRMSEFTAPMYTGTLEHTEHGEHAVACWFDDFAGDFRYALENEVCVDADGLWGWNPYPVSYTRDTLDAHCGTFEGQMLNEDYLGYPSFVGMDLRGAQLQGASLFFANILDSSWEGADLTGFEFGYARLSGTVDERTVWPEESCELAADQITCMR